MSDAWSDWYMLNISTTPPHYMEGPDAMRSFYVDNSMIYEKHLVCFIDILLVWKIFTLV